MNFKTLISLCDKKEVNEILEAISLHHKATLSSYIVSHPNILEPPVKADPLPEVVALTDDQKEELGNLILDLLPSIQEGEKGADLETVIEEMNSFNYSRDDVLTCMDHLLDDGKIYEPYIGKINIIPSEE